MPPHGADMPKYVVLNGHHLANLVIGNTLARRPHLRCSEDPRYNIAPKSAQGDGIMALKTLPQQQKKGPVGQQMSMTTKRWRPKDAAHCATTTTMLTTTLSLRKRHANSNVAASATNATAAQGAPSGLEAVAASAHAATAPARAAAADDDV